MHAFMYSGLRVPTRFSSYVGYVVFPMCIVPLCVLYVWQVYICVRLCTCRLNIKVSIPFCTCMYV